MTRLQWTGSLQWTESVAVLYQVRAAPAVGEIAKPLKPGGYRDSGADIAWALREAGIACVTPAAEPRAEHDLDWVFPDDGEGVVAALDAGADVLWANTVLHASHAVARVDLRGASIIGQRPVDVERFDDKSVTNRLVAEAGLPVARHVLFPSAGEPAEDRRERSLEWVLADARIDPPWVVKPVRGRGSQGVSVVTSLAEAEAAIRELVAAKSDVPRIDSETSVRPDPELGTRAGSAPSLYGTTAMVEEFLPGEEVTVSVLPPGHYSVGGATRTLDRHWALPAVGRFNHHEGVAPYSGVVAVTANSRAVGASDADPELEAIREASARAATLLDVLAPIRIDCRADANGRFKIFDVNLKPNMTGPGRPGRDDQDSLTMIAARELGWTYGDLLRAILANCRHRPARSRRL